MIILKPAYIMADAISEASLTIFFRGPELWALLPMTIAMCCSVAAWTKGVEDRKIKIRKMCRVRICLMTSPSF
jgi:hypothetical protein